MPRSWTQRIGLDFTNAEQFDAIETSRPLVLFYKDNASDDNPSIFDPELDDVLLSLHADPYADNDGRGGGGDEGDQPPLMQQYEAYVTRASYECRLHPQQAEVLAAMRDETVNSVDVESLVVLVYKRDAAARSVAKNRYANPFRNTINGLVDTRPSPPLLLYTQHSLEPYCRARIVWHREPRTNSTIGLIGLQIIERI